MQAHYKENVLDQLDRICHDSVNQDRELRCIELTPAEWYEFRMLHSDYVFDPHLPTYYRGVELR